MPGVAVVGAGMVGLATAWFLQERGVEVTVIERDGVAAGSSWGNAGWLTPGIATPLPEPAVLRYGLRAVSAPAPGLRAAQRECRTSSSSWRVHPPLHDEGVEEGDGLLVPINDLSLASFDLLKAGGVDADTFEAKSFSAAGRGAHDPARGDRAHSAQGGDITFDVLTGDEARAIEPALSDAIGAAIVLHGQRFIDPGTYVAALSDAVIARGGKMLIGGAVTGVRDTGRGVVVETETGAAEEYDQLVIATGAWLGQLARPFGVKKVVQAGRGYSFSVEVEDLPNGPMYFPAARVACTPVGDRLRVAGMMEFRQPEAALDRRRIKAIAESARPLLKGADLDHRQDEWVGSRPCTVDGLPLHRCDGVPARLRCGRSWHVGHHAWPVTGRLLAEQMVTGKTPTELRPFNPLR